jgi:hypothetical protein
MIVGCPAPSGSSRTPPSSGATRQRSRSGSSGPTSSCTRSAPSTSSSSGRSRTAWQTAGWARRSSRGAARAGPRPSSDADRAGLLRPPARRRADRRRRRETPPGRGPLRPTRHRPRLARDGVRGASRRGARRRSGPRPRHRVVVVPRRPPPPARQDGRSLRPDRPPRRPGAERVLTMPASRRRRRRRCVAGHRRSAQRLIDSTAAIASPSRADPDRVSLITRIDLETGSVTQGRARPHPDCGCAVLPGTCSADARLLGPARSGSTRDGGVPGRG